MDDKEERRCSVGREDSGESRGTFLSLSTGIAAAEMLLLLLLEVLGTGNMKWDISSSNRLCACMYTHVCMH